MFQLIMVLVSGLIALAADAWFRPASPKSAGFLLRAAAYLLSSGLLVSLLFGLWGLNREPSADVAGLSLGRLFAGLGIAVAVALACAVTGLFASPKSLVRQPLSPRPRGRCILSGVGAGIRLVLLWATLFPLFLVDWLNRSQVGTTGTVTRAILISGEGALTASALLYAGGIAALVALAIHLFLAYFHRLSYVPFSASEADRRRLRLRGSLFATVAYVPLPAALLSCLVFSARDGLGFIGRYQDAAAGLIYVDYPTVSPWRVFALALLVCFAAGALACFFEPAITMKRRRHTAKHAQPVKKKTRGSTAQKLILAGDFIAVFLAVVLFTGSVWVSAVFVLHDVDMLVAQLFLPQGGVEKGVVWSFVYSCVLPALVLAVLAMLVIWLLAPNKEYTLDIRQRRVLVFRPQKWLHRFLKIAPVFLLVVGLTNAYFSLNLDRYFSYAGEQSTFIEDNYVDPADVQLTFPETQRNLVYIFLESMETTFLSEEVGGALPYNTISEVEALVRDNVSFSHTGQIGGAQPVTGTTWTTAGMVAQHSGLPTKLNFNFDSNTGFDTFLSNVTSLGDILHEQGYSQMLMVGSDATYGGRQAFYEQHGQYEIRDYYTAVTDGIIQPGYWVNWGFEDRFLYQYAMKEISSMAQQPDPFCFTMLTVDTHAPDGYLCPLCQDDFGYSYFNAYDCAARQLSTFITWLQAQPFFENTTIVIAGDHPSISNNLAQYIPEAYQRTTTNIFINAAVTPIETQNRLFSSMDIFPSTLAAMGVEIEGDQLALGVNLFSSRPTLLEQYGLETVNDELLRQSAFYDGL